MRRVTSADMARKFSELCDLALSEPIIVTKNGRDRLVLLSVEEYNGLKDLAGERQREIKMGAADGVAHCGAAAREI